MTKFPQGLRGHVADIRCSPASIAGRDMSERARKEIPTTVADPTRIAALDGVRGVAILLVLFFHFTSFMGHSTLVGRGILNALRAGWAGVELFFALSGFLITGILWDARGVGTGNYFKAFYARRFLRIFPLYYGAIAFILLLGLLVPALHTAGFQNLWNRQAWLWLYGVNVGHEKIGFGAFEYDWCEFTHFWTLAVEEHFYLLWPLVICFLNRRIAMAVSALLIGISFALRGNWIAVHDGWLHALTATPRAAASLAMGAWLALALRGPTSAAMIRRVASAVAICSALALVMIAARSGGLIREKYDVAMYGVPCLGFFFTAMIALIVTGPQSLLHRSLENRLLVFFGKYSYGLYVFHYLFAPKLRAIRLSHLGFGSYTLGALIFLVLAFTGSIAISLISWNLFEKQILKFKSRFPYVRKPVFGLGTQGGGTEYARESPSRPLKKPVQVHG
jgi:peptidoglycan/LPS O-acetylase OafA/YrhL